MKNFALGVLVVITLVLLVGELPSVSVPSGAIQPQALQMSAPIVVTVHVPQAQPTPVIMDIVEAPTAAPTAMPIVEAVVEPVATVAPLTNGGMFAAACEAAKAAGRRQSPKCRDATVGVGR